MGGRNSVLQKPCRSQDEAAGAYGDLPSHISRRPDPVHKCRIMHQQACALATGHDDGIIPCKAASYPGWQQLEASGIFCRVSQGTEIPFQIRQVVERLQPADGVIDARQIEPGEAVEQDEGYFHSAAGLEGWGSKHLGADSPAAEPVASAPRHPDPSFIMGKSPVGSRSFRPC